MNIQNQYYDGVTSKPDLDDCLEHFGIKGMKWRRRKGKKSGGKTLTGKEKFKVLYNKTKRAYNNALIFMTNL